MGLYVGLSHCLELPSCILSFSLFLLFFCFCLFVCMISRNHTFSSCFWFENNGRMGTVLCSLPSCFFFSFTSFQRVLDLLFPLAKKLKNIISEKANLAHLQGKNVKNDDSMSEDFSGRGSPSSRWDLMSLGVRGPTRRGVVPKW